MEQADSGDKKVKVRDLISGARTAVLVTVGVDGRPDARPMACVWRDDFHDVLWFMTSRQSHKLEEIALTPDVLVSYADPQASEFVVVSGRARIVTDPEIAASLWSEAQRIWFPQGPDDSDLAVISVEMASARYWSNPASTMTYGAAYLRALLRGEKPAPNEIGETDKVDFNE
jgi:general stress protein 26